MTLREASVGRPLESSTWLTLSLLRFGLALIVAAGHIKLFYPFTLSATDPIRALASLNGQAAVVGFLLVSGFSIAHSITTEPSHYVWRRLVRIYPLYLLAIAIAAGIGTYSLPNQAADDLRVFAAPSFWRVLGNLFMLQGIAVPFIQTNSPLWTLSLEWWYYMLAPGLMCLHRRAFVAVLALLAGGYLSWLFVGGSIGHYSHALYGLNLLFLGVFWVLGFGFYFVRQERWAGWALLGTVWLLTGLNRESLAGNCQITLAVSCLALILAGKVPWPAWTAPPLRLLGNTSYPLYVLHLPLFYVAWRMGRLDAGWSLVLATALISALTHLLYEQPIQNWCKKRLRFRRTVIPAAG